MKSYPFVQQAKLYVEGGRGGRGVVHFRREKYVAKGGPDGGDGGDGGSIYFVASRHLNTLYHLTRKRLYRAGLGGDGGAKNCSGRKGKDILVSLPVGTEVWDEETGWKIGELLEADEPLLIASGGKGGRGNQHFASSTQQAPMKAEEGTAGEARSLLLKLKLLADVGFIGLPNAGKSTLLRRLSSAKPEVGAYPFTSKVPSLGVVIIDESFHFVAADIPGLIEGAHEGKGLGIAFLQQIERTKVLLHLIDCSLGKDPLEMIRAVRAELASFDRELVKKREIICFTKVDLTEVKQVYVGERERLEQTLQKEILAISAHTGEGVQKLLSKIVALLQEEARVHA